VSVELAQRLLRGRVLPREQLEAGLKSAVSRRVTLYRALRDLYPNEVPALDRAVAASDAPTILTVRAVPDLCTSLPPGLCESLLAVPVRQDPRTSLVDVAAVDPFDSHLAQEFSRHLGAPVRVLRAPAAAVDSALKGLEAVFRLVRRARRLELVDEPTPAAGPRTRRGVPEPHQRTDGGAGEPARPPSVIPLVRRHSGQVAVPRRFEDRPYPADAAGPAPSEPEVADSVLLEPARPGERLALEVEAALESLGAAASGRDVVKAITSASGPTLGALLVFAVRGGAFEGRGASTGIPSRLVRAQRLEATAPSVFRAACKLGSYLGCLPDTAVHAGLAGLLPIAATDEVYVVPVSAFGHPALVLMCAGFANAGEAARHADTLVVAAGRELERMVLERKGQA
jgi:hypothetical protein